MRTVHVPLGDRRYDVHIGAIEATDAGDRLARAIGKTSGVAVLVDARVAKLSPLVAPLVDAIAERVPSAKIYLLPPGESAKNLAAVEKTCEWLAAEGFDRGATIVGIGGGAATDHAGFVAAIYLRGVQFALCPTTLLAMVDASVGGKTGVDLLAGKNLVGAFHQPKVVLADLGFLETLPARERIAGLAEVVKAGLIADPKLFDRLEREGGALPEGALEEVIAAAVHVKADVVAGDEREGGRRAILNFGHTVGHAVESASGYELLHGEAVSLGMVAALALGVARGKTEKQLLVRTTQLLEKLGLPVDVGRRLSPEVLARIEVDKKRRSNAVRFVFVPRPGEAVLEDVPLDELKTAVLAAL